MKNDIKLKNLKNLRLNVKIVLDEKEMTLEEILKINKEDVLKFEKPINFPAELYVENVKIAKGEIVTVDNKFGIKITEIYNENINDI